MSGGQVASREHPRRCVGKAGSSPFSIFSSMQPLVSPLEVLMRCLLHCVSFLYDEVSSSWSRSTVSPNFQSWMCSQHIFKFCRVLPFSYIVQFVSLEKDETEEKEEEEEELGSAERRKNPLSKGLGVCLQEMSYFKFTRFSSTSSLTVSHTKLQVRLHLGVSLDSWLFVLN